MNELSKSVNLKTEIATEIPQLLWKLSTGACVFIIMAATLVSTLTMLAGEPELKLQSREEL